MRVLMGIQVGTLWQSLGRHREHFIPTMIGPFLQLTLVPEEDLRKATLPIIGDMMEYDLKHNGNFEQVRRFVISIYMVYIMIFACTIHTCTCHSEFVLFNIWFYIIKKQHFICLFVSSGVKI